MTIKKYLEDLPPELNGSRKDILLNSVTLWSNDTCRGYCLKAMQKAGFKENQIKEVLEALYYSFDELTEGEAEKLYFDYLNED